MSASNESTPGALANADGEPAASSARATEHVALGSSRFVGYLVAQSLGALNDNAFKMTLLLFALGSAGSEQAKVQLSSLLTAVFSVPWLLLSQPAGYLADRFRKDRVLLATKVPEVVFMAVGAAGFYLESLPLLVVTLLLMSTQSTLFSPSKYGMLPEVLRAEDLSQANGLLSMTTNLSILVGVILGTAMFDVFEGDLVRAGLVYVGIAVAGTAASLWLPRAPAGSASARWPAAPITQLTEDIGVVERVAGLPSTVLGLAYFSFLGGVLLTVIPAYGNDTLGLELAAAGYLPIPLVVGIAVGSVAAGRLSRGRVELGLVPLGAVLMAAGALDMTLGDVAGGARVAGLPLRAVVDLGALGFGAGLFSVPLSAMLQQRSPESEKGRVIAFSNIASMIATLAAAAATYALTFLPDFKVTFTMGALTLITVLGTAHIVWLLPDFMARVVVYVLVNVLYRLRIVGIDHLPPRGALLAANHVSWVDGLVVAAGSGRMVRFMMFRPIYEWWPLHWLFKALHVIPVEGGGDRAKNEASLGLARGEIDAGHAVCIFAEGAITRHGNLLGFRGGLERIASGTDAPIVPVYLDGLWGSLWSLEGGRVLLKWPRRFRHPIQVMFGAPLPASARAHEVRQAVQELSVDAILSREVEYRTLPVELVRSARRSGARVSMSDGDGRALGLREALLLALRVADGLRAAGARPGCHVAVAAPDDVRGAVAQLGVLCAGAVAVMLPSTAPTAARSALETAGVELAVTVRGEADRYAPTPHAIRWLDLDDLLGARAAALRPDPSASAGWLLRTAGRLARAMRRLAPTTDDARAWWSDRPRAVAIQALPLALTSRWLLRTSGRDVRRPACITFTRGRGGPPRPVVLSHANVLSNILALRQIFDLGREDVLLGTAPLSHSLGTTGTLWLPICTGAATSFARDPLDVERIVAQATLRRPTVLFTNPGVVARLVAATSPESFGPAFGSLERIVVGGRPVSHALRAAFGARSSAELLEAYGLGECSPLVAINIPDASAGASVQTGNRPGSQGHPLPGVAVTVRDPETGATAPLETDGALFVRGPNVTPGYLGEAPDEDPIGGWRDTGDIARLDREGFLTVLDRADQVIAHADGPIAIGRLEAAIHAAIGHADDFDLNERCCVTAVGDGPARAPAAVYVEGAFDPAAVIAALAQHGVPAHWIPRPDRFVAVTALPRHETGYLDRVAAAAWICGEAPAAASRDVSASHDALGSR